MPEPTRGYTAGETAELSALVARAGVVIGLGWSTKRVDRAIERVQERACAREAAEDAAREKKRQQKLQQRAERRAARSWF